MSGVGREAPTLGDAAIVVAVCFGWATLGSLEAVAQWAPTAAGAVAAGVSAAEFNDASMLSLVGTELVLAAIAVGFLALRRCPLGALLPRPSARGLVEGAALYGSGLLAFALLSAAFQPADIEEPIQTMLRERALSLATVAVTSLVNGAYEEVFLLGVLGERLRAHGGSIAVGVPLLIRLLYHLYQGPWGALSAVVLGLVWGLFHWRTGRLFPVVASHVLADFVPLL